MSLSDAVQITSVGDFQQRVAAAVVQAAVNVGTEVANEVQTLSISGGPTGGTFTLTYAGQTTVTIAFNANAATVQTALQNLTSIGSGNVICTGGPLPGTPITITFAGTLGNLPLNLITIGTNSLTGGSTPTPSVSRTTAGVSVVNHTARAAQAKQILLNQSNYAQLYLLPVAVLSTTQTDYPASNHYQLNVAASQADTDINNAVSAIFNDFN
jgi:hypothetical protein